MPFNYNPQIQNDSSGWAKVGSGIANLAGGLVAGSMADSDLKTVLRDFESADCN